MLAKRVVYNFSTLSPHLHLYIYVYISLNGIYIFAYKFGCTPMEDLCLHFFFNLIYTPFGSYLFPRLQNYCDLDGGCWTVAKLFSNFQNIFIVNSSMATNITSQSIYIFDILFFIFHYCNNKIAKKKKKNSYLCKGGKRK